MKALMIILTAFGIFVGFNRAQSDDCTPATGEAWRIGAIFDDPTILIPKTAWREEYILTAVQRVNACGGINGRPVELVERQANNREQAQQAMTELAQTGIILFIGSDNPAVSQALARTAPTLGVVYVELTQDLAVSNDFAWSMLPSPSSIRFTLETFLSDQGVDPANAVWYDGFLTDLGGLWSSTRTADSNPSAWVIQDDSAVEWCDRLGNHDGLLRVVRPWSTIYQNAATHLGLTRLLTDILPTAADWTVADIQTALQTQITVVADDWVLQQRQNQAWCQILPLDGATCTLQPFPTWRERDIVAENAGC